MFGFEIHTRTLANNDNVTSVVNLQRSCYFSYIILYMIVTVKD